MRQPLIGACLTAVKLSCFVQHGIPVPAYSIDDELLLLFINSQECTKYISLLKAIGSDLNRADPAGSKIHIQAALVFLAGLIQVLNCD